MDGRDTPHDTQHRDPSITQTGFARTPGVSKKIDINE